MKKLTMLPVLNTEEWAEVFCAEGSENEKRWNVPNSVNRYTHRYPVERENVERIWGIEEGEIDVASWIIYGELNDKRWFFLDASQWTEEDYGDEVTYWGGGSCVVAESEVELIRSGMNDEARARFKLRIKATTVDLTKGQENSGVTMCCSSYTNYEVIRGEDPQKPTKPSSLKGLVGKIAKSLVEWSQEDADEDDDE